MVNPPHNDVIPVRNGEELDSQKLEAFIRNQVDFLSNDRIQVLQFSAGHSNLTYQIKIGDWEAVLRRPPLGPVAPKAHDMKREYTILSEIHPYFSPTPKPIVFSDDESIIGAPFFIMERKHGVVIDSSELEQTPATCRQLSTVMVDQLVKLHAIPYHETGLAAISKPEGFMERQVRGWISRYERTKTAEIMNADILIHFLVKNIPSQNESSIIHYDYKLNNAMFNAGFSKMVGLFDWEMTTVGDPLADLGVAMSYWTEKDDPPLIKAGIGMPSVTIQDGFLSRKEFIDSYARKSGRDVSHIDYYLTFGYFKLAVICQQIYYRYKKGQTNDSRFSSFDTTINSLITHATNVAVSNV